MKLITFILISLVATFCTTESRRCEPIFEWSQVDFAFPDDGARETALATGSFIPKSNDIVAIAVWKKRVFTTIFRWFKGVGSSLNYVLQPSKEKSPILIPYPSFKANYINEDPTEQTTSLPDNSSVISAAHLKVDRSDRLWVFDMGISDYFGSVRSIAPPALVIFDLLTDTLIRRYALPSAFVKPDSLYVNLEVDYEGMDAENAFAYLPDMRGLVVYNFKLNRSWRLEHNYFGPSPHAGNLHYENINYHWSFGIFGMATGSKRKDGSRRIYFNPLVSNKGYYISNRVLKNETYIALNDYWYDVKYLGDRGKHGQTKTMAYDQKTGVLFQTLFERNSIGCWRSALSYKKKNFDVVYENDFKFYADDVTMDEKRNLWFLANQFPVNLYGAWNVSAVGNMKIYRKNIDKLIAGTKCAEDYSSFF